MSIFVDYFPQATQPTRSASSWAGLAPGSVAGGSAQEAALKDPGGFRAKLQMKSVQVGPATPTSPHGQYAYRLEHPDFPGQYFNFQPGERPQKARDAGIQQYSDSDLNTQLRSAWENSGERNALERQRLLELQRYNKAHQLQLQQLSNQSLQIQASINAQQEAARESKRQFDVSTDERKEDRKLQKDRWAVEDRRLVAQKKQQIALQKHQADVIAWSARKGSGSPRAQVFDVIGQALKALTA